MKEHENNYISENLHFRGHRDDGRECTDICCCGDGSGLTSSKDGCGGHGSCLIASTDGGGGHCGIFISSTTVTAGTTAAPSPQRRTTGWPWSCLTMIEPYIKAQLAFWEEILVTTLLSVLFNFFSPCNGVLAMSRTQQHRPSLAGMWAHSTANFGASDDLASIKTISAITRNCHSTYLTSFTNLVTVHARRGHSDYCLT